MIVGIGLDIVELEHMELACERQATIHEYILTDLELKAYYQLSPKRKLEFLAGRFAVKEAFSKAMGTGICKQVNFQKISVVNNERGQPVIVESPFEGNIFVSISHSKQTAVAQVILEKA